MLDEHRKGNGFVPFSRYRIESPTGDQHGVQQPTVHQNSSFWRCPTRQRAILPSKARLDSYEALGIARKLPYRRRCLSTARNNVSSVVLYAAFNLSEPALAQPGLRRAINLAFDRTALYRKRTL